MSMLLVMEAIDSGKLKMDDMVTASDYATSMGGSQAYIEPGEQFSVRDALKAVAIHSSNDVTVALAEKISGSEEVFVALMNEKAKKLGMKNTHFVDCTGLAELKDPNHSSTAYDVAIMSRELVTKHPSILKFTGTFMDKFRNGEFDLVNTNKLVHFYNGCDGLKTGYTSKAGYCLSATAKRVNMRLITVILGDTDSNTRFAETRKLLDYGFANFQVLNIDKKNAVIKGKEAVIKKGIKTRVKVTFKQDVSLLVKLGEADRVTRDFRLLTNLSAPVNKGQKVGIVAYLVDGKQVGQADVVAVETVKKASFIRLFFRMIGSWFGMGKS
jgi:D-alanyl-D-alanine carboxypeptidase (penicillin-binding protein 5/6)